MTKFTDNDIFKLDEAFAKKGIPFHQRPIHAAMELLGKKFSIDTINSPQVDEIRRAYERLIPEVNYTWPGMGTGLVASIDRVKKVTISVVFGTVDLGIHEGLGFATYREWIEWCRGNSEIAMKSAFAFADMHDLVYGIDQNKDNDTTFWGLAAEQLKLIAESLSQSSSISSPILQPICLTAELAIKGSLLYLGITEKELKNSKLFGHDLIKLGQKMTQLKNHRDDQLLLKKISKFPDYVGNRYRETELTRLEVISLALDAQFVAASAVRRITERDIAKQIETSIGPRSKYFS